MTSHKGALQLAFPWAGLLLLGLAGACSDGGGSSLDPPGSGHVEVDSDPRGAPIFVDGQDRRRVTPDTLRGLSGEREISARRDSAGGSYSFRIRLRIEPDSVTRILGPLTLPRCSPACAPSQEHTVAGIRFTRAAAGVLFYQEGSGAGAFWPSGSTNSYVSNGLPVFAGLLESEIPVALGMYDVTYLAGRPFPTVSNTATGFRLDQSFWLMPPTALLPAPTLRGIEVREELIGATDVNDVIVLRLVFRNITDRLSYRVTDPFAPPTGFHYRDAFVGFALDPDIGDADDDLFTYDPELDAVIAYDGAFQEQSFQSPYLNAPGMIGLRLLEAPAEARRVLNGWPRELPGGFAGDWVAGSPSEPNGYTILSGSNAYGPDHPSNDMGHLPGQMLNDQRIAVTAGPFQLPPGDSVVIRVALAFAQPAAGTFTSGTTVDSGDPLETTRAIMLIAEPVRARLRAAENIR